MSALSPILRDAEGGRLHFWCPGCDEVHGVRVAPAPQPWAWNGDAHRPTFSPSILVRYYRATPEGEAMMKRGDPLPPGMDRCPGKDEVCHSFVRDGQIQFLSDCTHKLAGQTVPLPAWADEETPAAPAA